jgi:ATP diphosphatase
VTAELPGPERPFARLAAIVAALRSDGGCPWDRAQDLESLLPHMESECREVARAVRAGDAAAIREELGDLLYNVVFMARVAEEAGWFDVRDVAREIGEKLIRRHPHVFADPRRLTLEEAERLWKTLKARERDDGNS